jgi:hypothetical protein
MIYMVIWKDELSQMQDLCDNLGIGAIKMHDLCDNMGGGTVKMHNLNKFLLMSV